MAHVQRVHDARMGTHRGRTRHTAALFVTIEAFTWSACASSVEDTTGPHACRGMDMGIPYLVFLLLVMRVPSAAPHDHAIPHPCGVARGGPTIYLDTGDID